MNSVQIQRILSRHNFKHRQQKCHLKSQIENKKYNSILLNLMAKEVEYLNDQLNYHTLALEQSQSLLRNLEQTKTD